MCLVCYEAVAAGVVAVTGWRMYWSKFHIWMSRRLYRETIT
jgi:hypothetical protein